MFPQDPENNIRFILIFFTEICRDIHKSRCTNGINDKYGKITAGVNYTFGKFATGINNTGEKLPPVSLVSLTPVANYHQYQWPGGK
jgi:hypothetical protein